MYFSVLKHSERRLWKKSSSQAFPLELSTLTFHLRRRYLICEAYAVSYNHSRVFTLCPCTKLFYDIPLTFRYHGDVNFRLGIKNLNTLCETSSSLTADFELWSFQYAYPKQMLHLKIIIWQEERHFNRHLIQNIQ